MHTYSLPGIPLCMHTTQTAHINSSQVPVTHHCHIKNQIFSPPQPSVLAFAHQHITIELHLSFRVFFWGASDQPKETN